jgi:cell division protein FtsW (lipid II flippase)
MQKMNRKHFLMYGLGTILWFILLAFMPMSQITTNYVLIGYAFLTMGLLVGFFGKSILEKRPWLLILLPFVALLGGVLK